MSIPSSFRKSRLLAPIACVALALLLGACASLQPVAPGATREQAIARHGQPSDVVALPNAGSRLQYSVQPEGRTAVMVDLDAAGRVVETRQMLSPAGFARVVPGQWKREDVFREFGRPKSVDHVYSWNGDIMTYRWLSIDEPMFFWVYVDPNGVVQKTGVGPDLERFLDFQR
ncbi:MAG: hypothetical protein EOO28_06730 [Comamonadaceae bacterium]|nr:MAG: hypothetical protein EOO28_06730 [Comamonadaceae bacterium]